MRAKHLLVVITVLLFSVVFLWLTQSQETQPTLTRSTIKVEPKAKATPKGLMKISEVSPPTKEPHQAPKNQPQPKAQVETLENLEPGVTLTKKYYDDEKTLLKTVIPYKDGKIHGEIVRYNKEGQIWSKEPFVLGQRHGVRKRFHPNGKIAREEGFEMGKPVGTHTAYWESGSLLWVTPYANGSVHGWKRTYHKNGQVSSEMFWDHGKAKSKIVHYGAKGEVLKFDKKGNPINGKRWR